MFCWWVAVLLWMQLVGSVFRWWGQCCVGGVDSWIGIGCCVAVT